MATARPIVAFALRLVILYAVLAAPWPGVRPGYAAMYRSAADLVLGSMLDGRLRFEPIPGAADGKDVMVRLRAAEGSNQRLSMPHDSRLTGYLPTAELIALVLATPLAWPRRLIALAAGLMTVSAFIGVRLAALVAYVYAHEATGAPGGLISAAYEVLAVAPTPGFVVPVLIWALVCFRPAEASAWMRRVARPAGPADAARHPP